jgi:hypothetical protein
MQHPAENLFSTVHCSPEKGLNITLAYSFLTGQGRLLVTMNALLEPTLVTINEAAVEVKKPYGAIYYRVNRGDIASHLAHGRLLVDLEEVRRVMTLHERSQGRNRKPLDLFAK